MNSEQVGLLINSVVISEEEGRRHRIAFNSLYLFSFRPIIYEVNGEALYDSCVERTRQLVLSLREHLVSPAYLLVCVARFHPGGVASMTRDKGYPDWLVLSARLLLQPSCGQVKIVQNICFGRVPLWLCEDITACCYMYCYFYFTYSLLGHLR